MDAALHLSFVQVKSIKMEGRSCKVAILSVKISDECAFLCSRHGGFKGRDLTAVSCHHWNRKFY